MVHLLIIAPNHAWPRKKVASLIRKPVISKVHVSNKAILKKSSIAYRATGGFTGLKSYSVLINCNEGKISVLKSLYRGSSRKASNRQRGSMTKREYLALWRSLKKQNVFVTPNAPAPKHDLHDQFTFDFDVRVGLKSHQFKVYGMSQPGAARYHAIKTLIDKASNMASLTNQYKGLAWR